LQKESLRNVVPWKKNITLLIHWK